MNAVQKRSQATALVKVRKWVRQPTGDATPMQMVELLLQELRDALECTYQLLNPSQISSSAGAVPDIQG